MGGTTRRVVLEELLGRLIYMVNITDASQGCLQRALCTRYVRSDESERGEIIMILIYLNCYLY